ncbi:TPA: type VI secretion system tube protein Hcp, partial [Enterobacter roggenkampii]
NGSEVSRLSVAIHINPGMPNAKMAGNSQINHMESVSLMYDKITWRYVDGNVQYTDDWNVRA